MAYDLGSSVVGEKAAPFEDIKDPLGQSFWSAEFGETNSVDWQDFAPKFYKYLGIPVPSENSPNFMQLRVLKLLAAKDEAQKSLVSKKRFNDLLGWFGPLKLPYDQNTGFIATLYGVVSDKLGTGKNCWFHGDVGTEEAEAELQRAEPGSFLVRFSTNPSYPTFFTISRVSRKDGQSNISHIRVKHEMGGIFIVMHTKNREYSSLNEMIRTESSPKLLGLSFPLRSQYQHIFEEQKALSTGYRVDIDPEDDDDEEVY